MSPRTVLTVALALTCGGSAAFGVRQITNQRRPAATAEKVQIVVAAVDIPRGAVITPDQVRLRGWPKGKDLVPRGAFTKLDEVLERTALNLVVQGEPILEVKLASKDAGKGMAALVPSGMRAYTIHTPTVASGVAGFILPGNKVDVLLTVTSAGNDITGGGTTTTLLQAVEILAVDQRLDAPADNKVDPKNLRSVTLLVTPDQSAKLSLGQTKGKLHLSLRNPEDTQTAETQPVTLADLRFRQEPPVDPPAKTEGEGKQSKLEVPRSPLPLEIRTLRGRQSGKIIIAPVTRAKRP